MTAGEGQVSIGATFSATTYDKLSEFGLNNLPLGSITARRTPRTRASAPAISSDVEDAGDGRNGRPGTEGRRRRHRAADHGDAGSGDHRRSLGNGRVIRVAETNSKFSGIGDMAAVAKFKVAKLPGPEIPDPGGLALMLTMRLPTGSRENLRGLGVYPHAGIGGVLRGKGPFKPHADGRLRVLEQERRRADRKRHRRPGQGPSPGAARRGL